MNIRNIKQYSLGLFASPYFIAVPLTLLFIYLIPISHSLYKITLKDKVNADKRDSKIFFGDLDNDGNDEKLIFFHNRVKGQASMKVMTNDDNNYHVWNFNGYFQNIDHNFYVKDLNHDNYKEIYTFYYRDDSVFMSVIQPFPNKRLLVSDKLITKVHLRNGKIDYNLSESDIADLNNDNNDELVFVLNAGYSRQPRKLFAFDLINNKLKSSSSFGAFLNVGAILDMDMDGNVEIYCGGSAPANIPDSLGYYLHDESSWFIVFDNNLELLVDPIENPGTSTGVQIVPANADDKQYLAVNFTNTNKMEGTLTLYEKPFRKRFSKCYPDSNVIQSNLLSLLIPISINSVDHLLLGISENSFVICTYDGEIVKIKNEGRGDDFLFADDLDKDGKNEMVFTNLDSEIVIYDDGLKNPAIMKTDLKYFDFVETNFGVKHNGSRGNEVYLKTSQMVYFYDYTKDRTYYLKFLIWLLIYILSVLFLLLIKKIQSIQQQQKLKMQNLINSLEMRIINSRLDPHFMFNVLNGLAHNVVSGNVDDSYKQIIKFSHLLRGMMKRTESKDVSLKDEIDFVTNYLELEKYRFKDDFTFTISLRNNVDQNLRIPRMLIQLLVENAVKHGFSKTTGIKEVKIEIFKNDNETCIIVEDNGIGRAEASKQGTDSGTGLFLIHEMIKLNKSLGGAEIGININDLHFDDGKPKGTKVEVFIIHNPKR